MRPIMVGLAAMLALSFVGADAQKRGNSPKQSKPNATPKVSKPAANKPAQPAKPKSSATVPARGYWEIPFTYNPEDGSMLVYATLYGPNGPKTGRFVFDTGYAGHITASERIDLGEPTGVSGFISHTSVGQKPSYTIRRLEMGDYVLNEKLDVPADDMGGLRDDGEPVDGLIGLSTVIDKVFEVSYEDKVVRVFPRASKDLNKMPVDNKDTFRFPFDPTSGNRFIFLPVTIGDKQKKMILDTGAQGFFAVIYQHSAKDWDLLIEKPKYISQAQDASGTHDVYQRFLTDVKVGPIAIPHAYATILNIRSASQDSAGALGSKFLQNFNVWIDFRGRMVYFERFKEDDFLPDYASVGIQALFYIPETKHYHAFGVMKESPASEAGIRNRDMVLAINGQILTPANFKELEKQLKGKPGDKVKLLVEQNGRSKTIELEKRFLVNGDLPPVLEKRSEPAADAKPAEAEKEKASAN